MALTTLKREFYRFCRRKAFFAGDWLWWTVHWRHPGIQRSCRVYRELAGDIADGKTAWPVDTGRTHLLFIGGPDGLSNIYHDAAQDIERSTNAIASYIDNNLPELTARAHAYAGVPSAIRNGSLSAKQLTRFMQAVDIADRKAVARDKNKHD